MSNPDLDENVGEGVSPITNTNMGGLAPQLVSTAGIPEPPPQTLSATGSVGPVVRLNPYGPDNRLDQGAIVFSYPDLIYDQFMEVQTQFEITDDTEPGTILLQIPYDPLSPYMNKYIRKYASLHSRYAGDILIRCFMIGNATYSGTLMWFWYPTKYQGRIAQFEDAQKYAYKTQSVVMPSVEEHVLGDARQMYFYRTTSETDIESRPHLVLAVHTSVVSPLREGIKVRLRIATRLASGTDAKMGKMCKPFMFADPQVDSITPGPPAAGLNGKTFAEVFPNFKISPLYLELDGTTTIGKYSYMDGDDAKFFTLNMIMPALAGGVFADANNKRLVSSNLLTAIVENDKLRVVTIIHQLPVAIQKAISTDSAFDTVTTGDNWLTSVTNMAYLTGHVDVRVSRVNSTSLQLFKDPNSTFEIDLVTQVSCVTDHGKLVVSAFECTVPSNDLKYAAMCGVPDTPQGSPVVFPYNPVLGPVALSTGLINYPSNWIGVKMVTTDSTVVNSKDEIAPSDFTDPVIVEQFNELAKGVGPEMVLQFDLQDPVSKTRVVTLRYLANLNEFVVNSNDVVAYRLYPGKLRNLVFANFGVIPTATSFPLSDVSFWPKRFSDSTPIITTPNFLKYKRMVVQPAPVSSPTLVQPNAMFAVAEAAEAMEAGEAFEGSSLASTSILPFQSMETAQPFSGEFVPDPNFLVNLAPVL
jgi:hypothetical protein